MLWSVFLTKLPILVILFSTTVRAVVVAKLVILGISPLTTLILALREASVANLVPSGILSSKFLILFSIHSLLHHLVYLNQQEQVLIHQHLIYLPYFANCLNWLAHFSIYQSLIYVN